MAVSQSFTGMGECPGQVWRADRERGVGKRPGHWCERNHLQGSAAENPMSFFSPGGGEEGLILVRCRDTMGQEWKWNWKSLLQLIQVVVVIIVRYIIGNTRWVLTLKQVLCYTHVILFYLLSIVTMSSSPWFLLLLSFPQNWHIIWWNLPTRPSFLVALF